MAARHPTTIQQRQEIARLSESGASYQEIATALKLSYWTARKWARQARAAGLNGLVRQRGRPATGPLSHFDPLVRYVALRLKREHPGWGAAYVVQQMRERPSVRGKALPDPATVWRYWRRFGERLWPKRQPPDPPAVRSQVAHGLWQLDFKESVPVEGVGVVTIAQARDTYSHVTVMHCLHPAHTPTEKRVKPNAQEVQQDCRMAFTRWGLPDAIQTDRATIFVADETTPFPTRLRLWWQGLGIEHRLIRPGRPQQNGAVERSHRTLVERTLMNQAFEGAVHLQAQIDADWTELNTHCPSRAAGCDHQPPLVAFPEASRPRRPYCPEWEADLFDLQRVDRSLATFTWLRPVSAVGQLSLGGVRYGIGVAFAKQTVAITFDPQDRHFVFTQVRPDPRRGRPLPTLAPVRRPAIGLSARDITGLPDALKSLPARQLMLPFEFLATARLAA